MPAALAQDQMGGIRGTVTDEVTHQPVRHATLNLQPAPGIAIRNAGDHSATTDTAGAFALDSVPAGEYFVTVQHRDYPQARASLKKIEVKTGEITTGVAFELTPAAAISGHILDEDADPLAGCNVQVHQAAHPQNNAGFSRIDENGEYRVSRLVPGKYIVSVNCFTPPFEARPFSAGPDPPPSLAYMPQYYGGSNDPKTAQPIEVAAGSEKSGIDFRMRPGEVTQIHGTFSPAGADWRGQNITVQLFGADSPNNFTGARVNQDQGTFDFPRVFPGSYQLLAFSNDGKSLRSGAVEQIDVTDKPKQVLITLAHTIDVNGTMSIESSDSTNKIAVNQFNVQLLPERQIPGGGGAKVNEDGSFTIPSLLPLRYRLAVNGPAFVKSAWLGNTDITDKVFDLSAEPLRIVLSMNFGAITGIAPAGQNVFVTRSDGFDGFRGGLADGNGNFKISNLAPGKYRVFTSEAGVPPDQMDEKGQEVTVGEGETVSVEVKSSGSAQ